MRLCHSLPLILGTSFPKKDKDCQLHIQVVCAAMASSEWDERKRRAATALSTPFGLRAGECGWRFSDSADSHKVLRLCRLVLGCKEAYFIVLQIF